MTEVRMTEVMGYLVQVGNGIELNTVGRQFEPYRLRPCALGRCSRTVVVIKLRTKRSNTTCELFLRYLKGHGTPEIVATS